MGNGLKPLVRPIVVFGLNSIEKPVAGTFADADAAAATALAKRLKLRQVKFTKPGGLELMGKLPAGIAGAKRVPLISPELYVSVLAAADREDSSPKPASSWEKITVGSLVLAQESFKDGWWEAVVLEIKHDTLTLAWRDFPRQPNITRTKTAVSLMPPL